MTQTPNDRYPECAARVVLDELSRLRSEDEVRAITLEMLDTLTDQQLEVVTSLRSEVEQMRRERDEAYKALKAIANHPHCDYDHPSNGGGQYGTGIADGHRCAAESARRALGHPAAPEGSPAPGAG